MGSKGFMKLEIVWSKKWTKNKLFFYFGFVSSTIFCQFLATCKPKMFLIKILPVPPLICLKIFVRTSVVRTNVVRTNVDRTNVVRTNVVGTSVAKTNVVGTNVARTNFARTNFARTNFARTNFARTNVVKKCC